VVNEPRTDEGAVAWEILERAGCQLRTTPEAIINENGVTVGTRARVLGFDQAAVLALAESMGAPMDLLLDVLPGVESALIAGRDEEPDDPEDWKAE
jgi:hypothetical protein